MENSGVINNTNEIINLIECFRKFFTNKGFIEKNCKSLISKHDPTLRFTNSTTSVLKNYLLGMESIADMILIQPAMGLQGVNEWIRNSYLGTYSSYFYSMGTLSSYDKLQISFSMMMEFLEQIVDNICDKIYISAYIKDIEFIDIIKMTKYFPNLYLDENSTHYIHFYGNDILSGRNLNIFLKGKDRIQEIGTLSIIEKEHEPVAVEISFDSSLLLCGIMQLVHPILTLPAGGILGTNEKYLDEELVLCDALNLSIALLLDGLKIKSRGRGGNLKKIINVYKQLANKLLSNNMLDISDIELLINAELNIKNHCNYLEKVQCSKTQKEEIVKNILR